MLSSPPRVLLLQPSPWDAYRDLRAAPAYTFHAYSPPASPPPDDVAPPALPAKRAPRPAAPFPTFLYANEPPPVTARNKQRVRPSPAQLAALKAVYAATAHPTREEREALGRRIGMRYQSVTNWFQNQRSTAKKRVHVAHSHSPERDDDDDAPPLPSPSPHPLHHHRHYPPTPARTPPLPPPTPAPAPRRTDPVRDIIAQQQRPPPRALPLALSGAAILPTLPLPPPPAHRPPHARPLLSSFQVSRTPTPAPTPPHHSPLPHHHHEHPPHHPHHHDAHPLARGKRSRPTPHQLAVLRALHAETASPSIEARVRVGREIGMELGKVTNWFRNLRQTARKKERRAVREGGEAGEKRGRGEEGEEGRGRKRVRVDEGEGEESAEEDEDDESMDAEEQRESSELGTESDAAHEAVTPEPGDAPRAEKPRAVSVDDALLLLALHDARA